MIESDKSYFYDGAGYAMRYGTDTVSNYRTPKQKAKRTRKRAERRKKAAAKMKEDSQ